MAIQDKIVFVTVHDCYWYVVVLFDDFSENQCKFIALLEILCGICSFKGDLLKINVKLDLVDDF